ncbi:MAG TPA: protein translocase subunit SecF [Thermoanaerobaculia bacterium]|jgi:preprotein translocase SecF subunit|nr:protein translocase subunit SecF [Thermoanaerobaculia bacterium]
MQLFVNTHYDFVKRRMYAVAFSVLFVLLGLGFYLKNGINWGIDFAGGANIVLKFKDAVPLERLRSDLKDAAIQQYGKAEDRSVLIRLPQQGREGDYAGQIVEKLRTDLNPGGADKIDLNFHGRDRLTDLFMQKDPAGKGTAEAARGFYADLAQQIINKRSDLGLFTSYDQLNSLPGITTNVTTVLRDNTYLGAFNVLNQETVGPQVGKELQQKAILAVILSTLAMGVYLWLRFDVMFGASAVVCILHDILISVAFLGMIHGEVSLNIVAALLLIVGFSINDTVVMYDRVRENRRKIKTRMTFEEQLNLAMNQTLSRTILTSGTVVIVLIALLLFGGKVIHEFAWILLIGVLAGTYSTITIVPAVAIAWNNATGRKRDIAGPTRGTRTEEPSREVAPGARKRKAG